MVKKINGLILPFGLLNMIYSPMLMAQNTEVEMADIMHTNGKIFVVIGVLVLVFIAITAYLIYIERRLQKLEKK